MLGRATIRLGIGPHSSLHLYFATTWRCLRFLVSLAMGISLCRDVVIIVMCVSAKRLMVVQHLLLPFMRDKNRK